MSFKEILKSIKPWQIGAIIGGVIGLIVGYFTFICHGEGCVLLQLLPPILSTLSSFISVMILQEAFHIDSNKSVLIMVSFLGFFSLCYALFGLLLGKILSLKTQERKNK